MPALLLAAQQAAKDVAERATLLSCLDHATTIGQHARVIALTAGLASLLRRDGPGAELDHGALGRRSRAGRTLRTPSFQVTSGKVHYLVRGGRAEWDDPLERHRGFLSDFVATQGVQTNEVQRSWVLLPLLLRIAQRTGAAEFDLVELGPSAGLNLVWDRYRYGYDSGEWGPEDALLRFEGEERRPIPGDLLGLKPAA